MFKKVIITFAVISLITALTGCEDKDINNSSTNSSSSYGDDTTSETSKPIQTNQDTMFQTKAPEKGDKIAIMETTKGTIKIKLFPEETPETVKNFEELAKDGKYEDVPFHRVIKNFMIQGGDFETKNGFGGYSYKGPNTSIDDEFSDKLSNIRGALSMANAGPNTNGSQFFIVHAPATPHLDGVHSVFGQVFDGMDVVDEIANVEVGVGDRPVEDVLIKSVEVTEYDQES